MDMKIFLLALLVAGAVDAQNRRGNQDDDNGNGDQGDQGGDEGTVKSKPVIIRLPKNRLSPELHSIASLRKEEGSRGDKAEASGAETPSIGGAPLTLPPAPPASPLAPPAPAPATPIPIQVRPSAAISKPQLQLPQSALNNPLLSSAFNGAGGSGLTGILANNPSLLKILQGIGAPPGIGGAGGAAPPGLAGLAGLSPGFGQGGLLAPVQGALPSLGQPPPFPGLGGLGAGGPPGAPDAGLLNVISSLGRQLGGAVGINNVIPGGSGGLGGLGPVGPSIPRISGLGGPPIAGIPTIPGLPVFPGAITPGGQLDVMQLISAISKRAFNGTSVTDVLPPNQIQKLADNLTNTLVPETPDVDLNKYMGRWFEGINSPRATDQRCVVHHYGGLTENGKTATYTALKIYREASEFGQVRYSIGYAFRGGRQEGMLQMHTSEAADPIPYWIYKVGPTGKDPFGNEQYEYAIISNWIRYPVMVLVRDPDQFKRVHEESVLRWLEEKGFINSFIRAFNLVQPVSYQNCQYADSTFELFG